MEKNYSPHIKPDVTTASATVEMTKVLLINVKEALAKYLKREREQRMQLAGSGKGIMKVLFFFFPFD